MLKKKVLSIDMDYIMGPSIQLYNDCSCEDDFRAGSFWEKVNRLRGIEPFLTYDEKKYVFLLKLLVKNLRRLEKRAVFFAEEHDMILELLAGGDKKDEIFEIYNLDHHHDLFYNPRQKEEVDRFNFASLASWAYYLGKNDKLAKYYWIHNENSQYIDAGAIRELDFPVDFDTYTEKYEELLNIGFDYVFVCHSSEYLPPKFNHLFASLLAAAEGFYDGEIKVWNEAFCKDGKPRNIAG